MSARLRRFVLFALAALVVSVVAVLGSTAFAAAPPAERVPIAVRATQIRPGSTAEGRVIHAGITVRNIYALDLSEQSFMAEGWYWLSWDDAVQAILVRYGIKPDQIIEFANEIEPAQYRSVDILSDSTDSVTNAGHSVYVKFSGKFYIGSVAQRQAPFDHQHLQIDMEIRPTALAAGADRVELVPVSVDKLPIAGEFASVSGYSLSKTAWQRLSLTYVEPVAGVDGVASVVNRYSRVTADLTYSPDHLTVFLKWLLPLVAVMGVVILAPSIDGALGDVRLAIPSAALLTLVVLHDGYKSNFPPTPYMTYLDKIYTYSYVVCFAIFMLFLVGTNAHVASAEAQRDLVTRRVNRLDLVVQSSAVVGFVVVALVGWFR